MIFANLISSNRNRRIVLASGAGLGQRGAQLLTTLVTLPLVLHTLGVAGFGVWGAATSLAWLAGMLDLGLGSALVTLLPRSISAGEEDVTRGYVASSLFASCGLSIVIVGGCGLLALAGARPMVGGPILLALIGLALNVPLSIARNVWFGLQKGYVAGFWEFIQTLLTLGLIMLAGAFHAGVLAMVGAVYCALLLANAGSLIHLFLWHNEIRPRYIRGSFTSVRIVLGEGGLLFGISVATSCNYFFDNLLTLHWLGPAASAQMTIALRLCTTASGLLSVIIFPLWPAFVDAVTRQDFGWALKMWCLGTAMVAGLAVSGAAAIIVFGAPALRWWLHADIGIRPSLLWATGAWVIALCVPGVTALLFNAVSILRFQLGAALLALGLSFTLKFVLARHFGVSGILVSSAFSWLLVIWPAFAWRLWHWVHAPRHFVTPLPSGI